MKILFASSSSGSRGGGEIYLLYLGEALTRLGHDVHLWVSDHARMDELAEQFAAFGTVTRASYINTYDYRGRTLSAFLNRAATRRASREWEDEGADVLHLNKQNLEDGLDLVRAVGETSLPSVCTVHITQPARFLGASFAGVRDGLARRVLRRYSGVFAAVGEVRGQELRDFLGGGSRVRTIRNGVPLFDLEKRDRLRAQVRETRGLAPDQRLVVAVGRMVDQKKPMRFLETAQRLYGQDPSARFLWVGDGELTGAWDAWVQSHDLEDVVARVGWQDEVFPFLAAADLFLHTARYEGMPFALIEAMSAGLPCAVPQSLADEMDTLGSHVLIADAPGFADAFQDAERLQTYARRGRALVERELSHEQMARRYEALYRAVAR